MMSFRHAVKLFSGGLIECYGGDAMQTVSYKGYDAVTYAKRWALHRNPMYYNFDGIGGDCTNFISQCIYAGAKVMNETPIYGWYYRSPSDRSASWTSVEYLFDFLTNNRSLGPFGHLADTAELIPGDVIQLGGANGRYYHSLLVVDIYPEILIAAHTDDSLNRPLSSYFYDQIRCVHIDGVRIW